MDEFERIVNLKLSHEAMEKWDTLEAKRRDFIVENEQERLTQKVEEVQAVGGAAQRSFSRQESNPYVEHYYPGRVPPQREDPIVAGHNYITSSWGWNPKWPSCFRKTLPLYSELVAVANKRGLDATLFIMGAAGAVNLMRDQDMRSGLYDDDPA